MMYERAVIWEIGGWGRMMGRQVVRRARPAAVVAVLLLGCGLQAAAAGDPHAAHRRIAERVKLPPCGAKDLDCRAFVGTLAWQPDERRPLLSSKGLRRLVLLRHIPSGQRERA